MVVRPVEGDRIRPGSEKRTRFFDFLGVTAVIAGRRGDDSEDRRSTSR